jgi:integrase
MSIRKRSWTGPAGEKREAWQVDYRDREGKRRSKQFARKKEADAWLTTTAYDVSRGTHTPDSQSITVAKAADNWLKQAVLEGLEPSTIAAYEQHVRLHIKPQIGTRRLNQLTKPAIETFRDDLLTDGRSKAMVARVLRSLSSIVNDAERTGYVAQNVCRGVKLKRGSREKPKVAPPPKKQMRALIAAADAGRPMDKPLLLILLFAGLRASEARALPWRNVDLKQNTITVDQRADYKNTIGPPKTAAGRRTIPVPEMVIVELRKWKLRCPASKLDLVFPSREGTPIFHANLVTGFQEPLQIEAGLTARRMTKGKPVLDDDGAPILEGVYSLHSFRHAVASLWIEQRVPPKRVQSWMGHSSIQVTFDTYGHLFAALEDDAAVMKALETGVFGPPDATPVQHSA